MANVNTILDQYSGSFYPQIASLANPTSDSAFLLQTNQVISSLGGGPAILSLTSAASQGGSGSIWDSGKPFRIRAFGRVTGGTTTNFTLKLYQVPSAIVTAATAATLANDNLVQAGAAKAVNSVSAQFLFEAVLQWDSVSQTIGGSYRNLVNGSLTGDTAITSVSGIKADTELNFLLTGLFSASNAGNLAVLSEFSIEQM